MKALWILTVVFTTLSGCATHPKELRIVETSFRVTDHELADYFVVNSEDGAATRISAPTLLIELRGSEPFKFIRAKQRYPQFRCHMVNSRDREISDGESGLAYRRDPANLSLVALDELNSDPNGASDFVILVYFELVASSKVNMPPDLSLLESNYDHVRCNLVGSTLYVPTIMFSNDIVISKSRIKQEYERYLSSKPNHGIETIEQHRYRVRLSYALQVVKGRFASECERYRRIATMAEREVEIRQAQEGQAVICGCVPDEFDATAQRLATDAVGVADEQAQRIGMAVLQSCETKSRRVAP